MNVLILCTMTNGFGRAGFYDTQEEGLAAALARAGHRVKIVKACATDEKESFSRPFPGIDEKRVRTRMIGTHGFLPPTVIGQRTDAVICFADTQLSTAIFERRARKLGIPFVPYVGTTKSFWQGAPKGRFMDALFEKTTGRVYGRIPVVAKQPKAKAELEAMGCPLVKVAPVGNGTPQRRPDAETRAKIREEFGFSPDDMVVLSIMRVVEEKRPTDLVRICAKAGAKLLLVGDGAMLAETMELAAELLPGRAVFAGRLPHDSVWKAYAAADRYVNLSKKEIFGMTLLEATSAGVPVAASRAPGPEFILKDVPWGLVADDDLEIVEWLEEPAPEGLDEVLPEWTRESFCWDATAESFLELIRAERAEIDGRRDAHG